MREKVVNILNRIVFPILLLLYPLIGVGRGASMTDTTYSLGNYMYFGTMTGSWKYATFLSNLTGAGLLKLSGGRMIVMSILTGLIIGIIGVVAYKFLSKQYKPVVVFCGELIALGLAWCPSIILYNYLTYLLLTLSVIVLYKAILKNDTKLFVIAGIVLGINVFVRISNVIEVLLIAVLWYGIALYNKNSEEKRTYVKPTLLCMAGFFIGLIVAIVLVVISGGSNGIGETVDWVLGLFSSKDEAGGYSLLEMVKVIVNNYLGNLKYFLISALGVGLGVVLFKVKKDSFVLVKKIVYTICFMGVFYYFYRNGVFTTNYTNNGAIFGICVLLIYWQFVLFIYSLISRKVSLEDKVLATMMIMILIITPLGSNNHLFTIINNMFLVLPAMLGITHNILKAGKDTYTFAIRTFGIILFVVLLIQSALFHGIYVFADGEDGASLDTAIENSVTMRGIYTSKEHALCMDGLYEAMDDGSGEAILIYGNIPGVSYMLERPCAIATSWPDLDSFSVNAFHNELEKLEKYHDRPPIVINASVYRLLTVGDNAKDRIMLQYILENGYHLYYTNDEYIVLVAEK